MKFARRRHSQATGERRRQAAQEAFFQKSAAALSLAILLGLLYVTARLWRRGLFSGEASLPLVFISLLVAAGMAALFCLLAWSWGRRRGAAEMKNQLDHLTGTLTPVCFEEVLGDEIRRAGRYRYPLVLCRLDLDDFGSLAGSFGSERADQLLKRFCEVLQSSIRFTDTVGRYRADEFCVLLPHTNLLGAEKILSRLLAVVEEQVDVSFCAGVTLYRTGESRALFLMRAGQALEEAKREGKKRIACMVEHGGSHTVVNF